MIAKCAMCNKICNRCIVKQHQVEKEIDFCCYEHYLKFWFETPGFVPFKKSQVKK